MTSSRKRHNLSPKITPAPIFEEDKKPIFEEKSHDLSCNYRSPMSSNKKGIRLAMEGYKREGLSSSKKNHQKIISFGMNSTPTKLSRRVPSLSPSNQKDKENKKHSSNKKFEKRKRHPLSIEKVDNYNRRSYQESNDVPDSDDSYNKWHLQESQKMMNDKIFGGENNDDFLDGLRLNKIDEEENSNWFKGGLINSDRKL